MRGVEMKEKLPGDPYTKEADNTHSAVMNLWRSKEAGTITQEKFDSEIKKLCLKTELNVVRENVPPEIQKATEIFNPPKETFGAGMACPKEDEVLF